MEKFSISPTVLRFIIVGGLNTAFGFLVYAGLALTPMPTWAILIATNMVTILFNFVTTGGLVFRDMDPRRAPRFLLCYLITFLLYWAFIKLLSPVAGGRIGAMAIIVLPVAVLTYLMQSRFVFGPKKQP